jgi:6-methylsalicylate decarboxylase
VTAPPPAPLIDVHGHFLPARYVEEAQAAGHERADGMP